MLCQFSVKNFQCIKDEITLDMQATGITENNESLLTDTDNEKFLPLGVIYGPNGSGKSTVLFAIYSLACKIMRPICAISCDNKECLRRAGNIYIKPFKFAKETINEPTEFEIFFRTDISEYQYKLSILKEKVIEESLFKKILTGSRYTMVFKRKQNGPIYLSGSFKKYNVSDISDNLTLLSYFGITHRRNKIIKDILNWFDHNFHYIDYGNPIDDAKIAIIENKEGKSFILNMLAEMDIDVSDYIIDKKDEEVNINTFHMVGGKKFNLELSDESSGTIKIFGLLPYIINSLLYGKVLVIDELDSKLHPKLLQYVIGLFNNPTKNKNNAQLIFTSHDLSTMNSDNFRRDEIWFIAKGNDLASKLYSLVEFKDEDGKAIRKDAKYDKQYLEGRYGADPYLRKIINWGEL